MYDCTAVVVLYMYDSTTVVVLYTYDCTTVVVKHMYDCTAVVVLYMYDCTTVVVLYMYDCTTVVVLHTYDCTTVVVLHMYDCTTVVVMYTRTTVQLLLFCTCTTVQLLLLLLLFCTRTTVRHIFEMLSFIESTRSYTEHTYVYVSIYEPSAWWSLVSSATGSCWRLGWPPSAPRPPSPGSHRHSAWSPSLGLSPPGPYREHRPPRACTVRAGPETGCHPRRTRPSVGRLWTAGGRRRPAPVSVIAPGTRPSSADGLRPMWAGGSGWGSVGPPRTSWDLVGGDTRPGAGHPRCPWPAHNNIDARMSPAKSLGMTYPVSTIEPHSNQNHVSTSVVLLHQFKSQPWVYISAIPFHQFKLVYIFHAATPPSIQPLFCHHALDVYMPPETTYKHRMSIQASRVLACFLCWWLWWNK